MSDFFVPGGTMKPGAPSYIERRADDELYRAVIGGEYCTVLTTRQMGKSSLMARTAARLREQAAACATVDLQGKGDKTTPPEQWYYGVAKQIADGLVLPFEWTAWWKQQQMLPPAQRLTDLFADLVLQHIAGPVVVFVDEVDWTIDLPFSDEFFAAIRSCFNRRATDPPFARLTFVLLGSASPAQLIKSATRTPFNIGRGIELTDFTAEEARQLAAPLDEDGDQILARILYWTDGHPYLTQMLCAQIATHQSRDGANPSRDREGAVDTLVQNTLLSPAARQQENNLKFVGDRLTQGTRDLRRVLRTYRTVLHGKPVKDVPASPVHTSLRLSGVVKPDAERRLQVRNRVYRQVFNERWVKEKTPADLKLIAGSATAVLLIAIFSVWYLAIFPRPYIQVLETARDDVQVAYNAYDALYRLFHRAQADDLLAQFFERRGDRDEAILIHARAGGGAKLAALVGPDYPLLERTLRHEGAVNSVAFSPDGKLVATGSDDKAARVFEAATGREVSRLAHEGIVWGVTFSHDGRLLATVSWDSTARIFDVATGGQLSRLAHQGYVNAVAFSPDGKLLATGSDAGTVRFFEAATGREVSRLAHQDAVWAVVFSPDGKLLVTGSRNDTAQVFESATGRGVSHLAHQDIVYSVAFSPDGKLLATGSQDKSARVFEIASGKQISRLAHQSFVAAVAFRPDGKLVATASGDNISRVFEAATGREVSRLAHQDVLYSVAFSPNGKLLATASRDHTVRIFEVPTGSKVPGRPHDRTASAVAFSPDSKLVATASKDDTAVHVFEAVAGREVSRLTNQATVNAVAFSPDGKLLATGSDDKTAHVFEATTGRELSRLAHQDAVNTVAFSPDGKLVATGSLDKTARVFETSTGREVSRLNYQDRVDGVAFGPDSRFFVIQTGNWLHLYQRSGNNWRPIANRHLPVIWRNTVRFLPVSARCHRCVEVVRDVPENQIKLERINFDEYPPPIQGDPKSLVAEWSVKLGLTFDARGHIVPLQP